MAIVTILHKIALSIRAGTAEHEKPLHNIQQIASSQSALEAAPRHERVVMPVSYDETGFDIALTIPESGSGTKESTRYGIFVTYPAPSSGLRSISAISAVGTNNGDLIVGDESANIIDGLGGPDIVFALGGDDTIDGGGGDDVLYGGNGQDAIHGGGGNDTIVGGLGANHTFPNWLYGDDGDDTFIDPNGVVDGGVGNDTLRLSTLYGANIFFNSGDVRWLDLATGLGHYAAFQSIENFVGSEGRDEFWLGPGIAPIVVHGGRGDDFFHPAADGISPHSFYYGDEGDDFFETLSSVAGASFFGGAGDDFFWVNENTADHFDGGAGHDVLRLNLDTRRPEGEVIDLASGQIRWVVIFPAPGFVTQSFANIEHFILRDAGSFFSAPTVLGTGNDDIIEAYLSGYEVFGAAGADVLLGLEEVQGGQTTHRFFGGIGNDWLDGGAGDDSLIGDAGDDLLIGGAGSDLLDGSAGTDTASYAAASSGVTIDLALLVAQNTGGAGVDTLTSIENLVGSAGNDSLLGDGLNNVLVGGLGDDTIDGRDGVDTADYAGSGAAVTLSLAISSSQNTVGAGRDTLIAIENILGSEFGDSLTGNDSINGIDGGAGADVIHGEGGEDQLVGGAGDDIVYGGAGVDFLAGGVGNDRLVSGAGDNIVDGGAGEDVVDYGAAPNAVNINLASGGANGYGATDTLTGVENLIGSNGADTLIGDAADNELEGGLGNDLIIGGGGEDIASYAGSSTAVNITMAEGLVQTGSAGVDTFNGVSGLRGSAFNDVLNGDAGDNSIEGGSGADTLSGGSGEDTASYAHSLRGVRIDLRITTSQDTVGQGLDTLTGFENILGSIYTDVIRGNEGANIIIGNGGANDGFISGGDNIWAGGGDDTIIAGSGGGVFDGEDGNDVVYGGSDGDNIYGLAGIDILYGGGGADIFNIDHPHDQVIEYASVDIDWVHVYGNFDYTAPDNIEAFYFDGPDANGHGNALDNQIITGSGNNQLFGLAGNDYLAGGYGDDLLVGGQGADRLVGSEGYDTVSYLDSGVGVQVVLAINMGLFGDAEGDVFESVESLIGSSFDDVLGGDSGVNAIGGGSGADIIRAGDGNDALDGGSGNDILDGGAGADSLLGGAGNDVYVVDNELDVISELVGEGVDSVQSSITWFLFENVEHLTLTDSATINGSGNELANIITGNGATNQLFGLAGNDTLDGGAGADSLFGGLGDDLYIVDNAADFAFEGNVAWGVDLVQTSVSYALGQNIDNLTLLNAALVGSGNLLANVITGNANANTLFGMGGNDTLNGAAGVDQMFGGLGDDTYIVDDAADFTFEAQTAWGLDIVQTSVSYQLGQNIDNLVLLSGAGALTGRGNLLANTLTGNESANTLFGFAGNDTLDGGLGADQLYGREGNDTYIVDNVGDVVAEANAAWGTDAIFASVTYFLSANIEHLTLAGAANINGNGNGLNNTIIGNSGANNLFGQLGNDVLDGGAGADSLFGGEGDDIYIIDNAGDVGFEASAAWGIDLVQSSVSHTLGTNLDNLTLTGAAAINATGNNLANTITGNAAANQLFGHGGADTLAGGAGADSLDGGAGDDAFVFAPGSGTDTVTGFVAGGAEDTINLSAYNGSGVTWSISQIATDTVFAFSNGDQITLTGVTAANLVQTDPFGYG